MMFKLLLNVEENALTILMRIQTHSIEIIFSILNFLLMDLVTQVTSLRLKKRTMVILI